jgi:DNA topoisomerase-2
MMDGKVPIELTPWCYGFTGKINKISENKYKITGKYDIIDDEKIRITEIPFKGIYSTGRSYKLYLESLIGDKNDKNTKIIDVFMNKGNNKIDFEVTFKGNALQQMIKKGDESFEKMFKLSTTLTCNNMYAYNTKNELTHYNSPQEILDEFYNFRLGVYTDRKKFKLRDLENDLLILKYKVQFIKDKISGKIILDKQKKTDVHKKLEELKYPKLSSNVDALEEDKDYKYIENMNIFSVTEERIEELNKEYEKKQKEYDDYVNTSEKDFWRRELKEFVAKYEKWMADRIEEEACELPKKGKGYEKVPKKTRKSKG